MSQKPFAFLVLAAATLLATGCPGPSRPASKPAEPPVAGVRTSPPTAAAVATPSQEWRHWRGANHDGVSPQTNWTPPAADDAPPELWKASVGIGFSSISVGNGRVYTMGHANNTDTVFCFDHLTGKELWTHSYPTELDPKYYEGGPSATPAIDGNAVYTISKVGDVYCLEASTGKVIWSKNISQELGAEIPTWGFAGSPLVQGELLIVNVGKFGTALNKNTGAVVWTTGKEPAGYGTAVPFTMDGKMVLAVFGGKAVAGISLDKGEVLWTAPWKTDYDVNAADPIISGNTVFVSSSYGTGAGLFEFGPSGSKQLWTTKEMRNHYNSCVLIDGHLYGIDGHGDERKPQLKCLELKTGRVVWAEPVAGTGTLIASDGKLIVLAGKGELIIAKASPAGFEAISRSQVIGGKCWTAPALSDGLLYVRNAQGTLVCLDLRKKG